MEIVMSLIDLQSLKCPACSAPYSPGQQVCGFCNTPLPQSIEAEPLTEGSASDGTEEIVDYYAMIGLSLMDAPGPNAVGQAALETQQRYMLNKFMDKEERNKLVENIEIAHWILTDDRARREYDGILMMLRNGIFNDKHIGMLGELQQKARRELGLTDDHTTPQEWLQQGTGYQALGMHREAAHVLKKVIDAMPDTGEAHYRYAQALMSYENPLSKGGHELRQAAASFKSAAQLDPSLHNAVAYEALCQGLLARQDGDTMRAKQELQRAVNLDANLGAAWLSLAALALQEQDHANVLSCCRRALLCDAQDEQAYLFLVASCWRAGQRERAYDAANRVAALRGSGWNAKKVLREIIPE
jgi:tetratricopeptide (TPR) repeat protein